MGNKKQQVTVLGATGSVGSNTLEVINRHSQQFAVFALTAHTQLQKLVSLCVKFRPKYAVVNDVTQQLWLQNTLQAYCLDVIVLYGAAALVDVATTAEVDIVVAAIVGAAGCPPTFAAAKAGKKILLANKETLVIAGALFFQAAKQNNAVVLPVDSEHNAIFQVLPQDKKTLKNIILTASGGPFLNLPLNQFEAITVAQALKHPNWQMGQKISIDSATMMNKALEVIEAYWLFDLQADQIEVIIHPESIIHSMVRLVDESVLAQLAVADMKIPIAHCLGYPARIESMAQKLDFSQLRQLNFIAVDTDKFPALQFAYEILKTGKDSACVMNAANEIAVELFLQHKIRFVDIINLVNLVLDSVEFEDHRTIASLLEKNNQIRRLTTELAKKYSV